MSFKVPEIPITVVSETDWIITITVNKPNNGGPFIGYFPFSYFARLNVRTEENASSNLVAQFYSGASGNSIQDGLLAPISSYQIGAYMKRAQTNDFPAGTYYYDVRVRWIRDDIPNDFITTFQEIKIKGIFTVKPKVTQLIG